MPGSLKHNIQPRQGKPHQLCFKSLIHKGIWEISGLLPVIPELVGIKCDKNILFQINAVLLNFVHPEKKKNISRFPQKVLENQISTLE